MYSDSRIAPDDLEYKCSGSLISEIYVITAGFCIDPHPLKLAKLGRLNLTDTSDDLSASLQIIVKKNVLYSTKKKENLIALIELMELAKFSDFVKPICLNTLIDHDMITNQGSSDLVFAGKIFHQ